ncbi:MAG: diaminopimelate epimerase [Rhodobacteraceae bacterium]|nr:MAG: diaminopimelate epimerase [Paracoccaceae bacterium]
MDARPTAGPAPLAFRKAHGLGNDFVVIDARSHDRRGGVDPMTPALARAIGDRRRGVGFDQLVTIHADPEADARLVFWNADGSTAGACGNATRCVADMLMTEAARDALTLRTARGLLRAERRGDRIAVDMGAPDFDWRAIPLAGPADTLALPIEGAPVAVSMGNPHCVFFVADADAAPVTTLGPEIERHPLFPERANVGFAEIRDRETIRLRVWERGAGLTLACGSGACAAMAAAVRRGLASPRARLILDGGDLEMAWDGTGGVEMTGPVAHVFEGALTPAFLAAVA